jgi:hypothetical protein
MDLEEEPVVDESLYIDESKKYKNCYDNALQLLNINIDEYTTSNNCGIVNIIPYSVNKRGKYPFIEFILNKSSEFYKNEVVSELNFNRFFYMTGADILDYSNKLLNASFSHVVKDESVDFNKYYKGYVNENHIVYLFYDCTEINKDSTVTNLYNMWITLSEEICRKSSCDISINGDVVEFFTNNRSFLYLTDADGHSYELPDVGFTGSTFKKAEFRSVFSNMASSIHDIFGPYYYFTSYKHAIEDAREEKSKTTTNIINYGGLNRYALFKGKSISFYNFCSEDTEGDENNSEKDWSVNNDSIYIENLIALKKYEQHVPISYHLV